MTPEARAASDTDQQESLAELIYAASVEPARWQDFLEALSQTCGDAAVGCTFEATASGVLSFGMRFGLQIEYSAVFDEHVRNGFPWGELERFSGDHFVWGSDFLPDAELESTDFYREFMAPQDLAPSSPLAHVIQVAGGQAIATVSVWRRCGGRALREDDRSLCDALVPHLSRAFRIHYQMRGDHERRRALGVVVDRLPMGVMQIDSSGRVAIVNRAAERILALQDGIMLDRDRPVLFDRQENERLADALRSASKHRPLGPERAQGIAVTRPSGAPPFSLRVNTLLDVPEAPDSTDAVAVIFVSDSSTGEWDTEVIQKLYGLTPAEASLVCRMIGGASIEEAAKLRGITANTGRSYLKAAYKKTGTNSQQDLIRLVLSGVGSIQATE